MRYMSKPMQQLCVRKRSMGRYLSLILQASEILRVTARERLKGMIYFGVFFTQSYCMAQTYWSFLSCHVCFVESYSLGLAQC